MKRILAAILALVMLLAMTACFDRDSSLNDTIPNPVKPDETTAPQETEAPKADMVSLGRVEDGVYTNTYAGFACTLDENWTLMTAEQLQQLPGAVAELLEGSELLADSVALETIADMMAENTTDLTSINVQLQKVPISQRLVYLALSDEQILDEVLKLQDTMMDAYAQAGITVEKMEKKQVPFLGEQRWALHTTATVNGINYYILQFFDYSKGSYGITLTLGSFVEDNTASLLSLFTPA